jgi:hypothetical protein
MNLPPENIIKLSELVPPHLHGGLVRYIEDGTPPGNFLTAVLDNKLFEAYQFADDKSAAGMHGLIRWLYNYAPSQCFGSKEKRVEWLLSFGGRAPVTHA